MIFLFAGDDSKKKLERYEKFVKSLSKSEEVFYINRNEFDPVQIENFYSGGSLFSPSFTVVFKDILEHEETRDFLLQKLSLIGGSKNTFVFLENKLTKPVLEAIEKAGAKISLFELPKEKKEKFDNFLVANAFSRKDKLNTWIYFRQAMDKGVGMEEIVGVLFWKIKDMLTKKNLGKFSESELKDSAAKLAYLLPQARQSGLDVESVFEKFLLETF